MPAINELLVFEHGDESRIRVQRAGPSDSVGAWMDGQWTWDEDLFNSSLVIYADGVAVENVEIVKKTSPDNDIEAWPMISDYDDASVSNFVEFWIRHDMIDRDAVVTFDLAADVVTESTEGNVASSGDSATNYSTYKADPVDQLDDDAEICFYNPSTSDPVRMPRAIDSLGTPDGSWNDGDTIAGSSIPYGECVLTIELQFDGYDSGADYEGCVFEYGDASAGISFAFETDHRMRFRCGNSTDSIEIEQRVDFPSVTYFVQGATYEVTFHIQPASNRIDLYFEGMLRQRFTGTIGDWSTSSAGAVGQVNGAFFAHSSSAGIPGTRSSTWDIITGLRHWDGGSPTIEFTANSKAFFPVEVKDTLVNESALRSETVILDEWSKYFYAKSDFADIRSPGSVFEVNDMQFVWEWYRDSTSRGGNGNPAHGAVLLKSGETLGLDRKDHCNDYPSRNGGGVLPGIDGESRLRPFVVMRYGGSDPISIDLTASTSSLYRDLLRHRYSYWILEDRILDVECSTTYDGQHGVFEFDGNEVVRQTRVGGYRVQDCPLRPIGFRAETMNGTENNYGITIGEMSIVRAQRGGANGSLFGRGAHDPFDGGIQRVQIGRSLWHNEYDWTSSHVHTMYIKGRIPYLHIKGGWCPEGPGAVIKNDGNERSVFRDFIAWRHQNGGGASHNGNSSLYGTSVDRSEASGDAAFARKCFWVDCIITDIDDYTMGVTASIDCEYENCLYFSNIDQNAFYVQCNGSSDQEAQGFSDSYRVGAYNCTVFMNSGIECEVPLTDDRSLVDSLGSHGVFWAECLFVNFAGTTRAMVRWVNDSVDDGVSLGRFEDPRFRRCHFANRGTGDFMDDGGTTYATLAAADAGISEPMFDECNEGSVSFDAEPASTNPILDYFSDEGYVDEDAVISAIDAAYFNGWDSLADALKIETVFDHFASVVQPTNLDTADTGGAMPGIRAPETSGGGGSGGPVRGIKSASSVSVRLGI